MGALDFIIGMQDKISPAARSASGALAKLEKELKRAEDQLEMMQARAAAGNNRITPAQILSYDRLTSKIAGTKASIASLAGEAPAAESALSGVLAGLPGLAAGAITALGALGAALGALIVKGAIFALETADEKRSLLLQAEALLGSADAAKELVDQIDDIAAKGVVSEETLTGIAKGLAGAGYKGKELAGALDAVSTAAASGLEGASEAATKLYEKIAASGGSAKVAAKQIAAAGLAGHLKEGKVSAEQLGKAIKERFGDLAGKQALGLKAQLAGLKHNFGELFEDVAIEPFLNGLKELTSLFNTNTNSGKALKSLVDGFFSGLLSAVSTVFPLVKRFFQGLIIGALELVIFLAPAIKQLSKLLGLKANSDLEDMFVTLGEYAVPVLAVMAATLAIVVIGLAALAAVALLCTAGILLIVGAAIAFSAAIAFAVAWAVAKLTTLGVEAINAGLEFTNGLVDGITSGGAAVVAAVKSLADKAIGGFKAKFGIASPSKVMASMGEHMMTGFEVGVGRGGASASGALSDAIKVQSPGGSGASGGSTINVTFGDVVLNGSSSEQAAQFKAMVIETFENLGLQLGAVA